jgi:hypothetical protein
MSNTLVWQEYTHARPPETGGPYLVQHIVGNTPTLFAIAWFKDYAWHDRQNDGALIVTYFAKIESPSFRWDGSQNVQDARAAQQSKAASSAAAAAASAASAATTGAQWVTSATTAAGTASVAMQAETAARNAEVSMMNAMTSANNARTAMSEIEGLKSAISDLQGRTDAYWIKTGCATPPNMTNTFVGYVGPWPGLSK